MTLWQWLVAWLVWLSSDPATIDLEAPKAAAAVAVARATLLADRPGPPGPKPPAPVACDCGQTCIKGIWKPDTRIPQECRCQCARCVAERAKADCPDGKCPKR